MAKTITDFNFKDIKANSQVGPGETKLHFFNECEDITEVFLRETYSGGLNTPDGCGIRLSEGK